MADLPDETARRLVMLRSLMAFFGVVEEFDLPLPVTIVALAVCMCEYEKRPCTVKHIVSITGIKRSSVIRHLELLKELNMVKDAHHGARKVLVSTSPEHPRLTQFFARINGLTEKLTDEFPRADIA